AERENPVYEHPVDEAGSNRGGIPLLGYLSMSCGTVREVIRNIIAELDLTLALLGCTSVKELPEVPAP
ncbi:MAG: hypothetical protein KM310_09250, partial [Clostridiales bacterium]|nr:hypothetical protein [Clostridiales bacterium]